jgi:hypothetical protein
MILAAGCAAAHAATAVCEVQGVKASDSGKKDGEVPASLDRYKKMLQDMMFGKYEDLGRQSVKGAAGGSGNATFGAYTIEVSIKTVEGDKATVAVTIKEGGNAIGDPTAYTLTKGKPRTMQVGKAEAPTIVILTLEDTQ